MSSSSQKKQLTFKRDQSSFPLKMPLCHTLSLILWLHGWLGFIWLEKSPNSNFLYLHNERVEQKLKVQQAVTLCRFIWKRFKWKSILITTKRCKKLLHFSFDRKTITASCFILFKCFIFVRVSQQIWLSKCNTLPRIQNNFSSLNSVLPAG